jgi:hypothetical protein
VPVQVVEGGGPAGSEPLVVSRDGVENTADIVGGVAVSSAVVGS